MKNIKPILLSLFFLSYLSLQAQEFVNIKIKQDYQTMAAKDGVFKIQRKPFKLVFHVRNTDGFCIGFTQDEDIYRSAIGEADMEVMWFENTGMAEGRFNEDLTTMISDEAPSYWYFTAIDDHRFDKNPYGTQQEWLAERTVNAFYLTEFSESFKMEEMVRPVYVVVYEPVYDEDYNLIDKKVLYHAKIDM